MCITPVPYYVISSNQFCSLSSNIVNALKVLIFPGVEYAETWTKSVKKILIYSVSKSKSSFLVTPGVTMYVEKVSKVAAEIWKVSAFFWTASLIMRDVSQSFYFLFLIKFPSDAPSVMRSSCSVENFCLRIAVFEKCVHCMQSNYDKIRQAITALLVWWWRTVCVS